MRRWEREDQRAVRYALLAVGIVTLAVAGYGGYVLYPRFNSPPGTGAGLLVLAVAAGVVSFFSPCSFPLLVDLLGRSAEPRNANESTGGIRQALRFGAALSMGAGVFLLLMGAGIAAGSARLFEDISSAGMEGSAARVVIGLVLVVLGLVQVDVVRARALRSPFHKVARTSNRLFGVQAQLQRHRPTVGRALFGFIYLLAGFG